ncbi:unnamed protein product [Vitrella brassicaformis CCMP3155]|uniref:Integrase catalytic domain-containing protein n=1 Tax=Vitrella brassicaformis (strain CCMP3155) TaxID=1169540 RepID=A0A0G4GGN9_VITBC|nr:unnamed protein product [Vitrella brassicaformis CCMP3155]|eukprot:CEM28793.1 unnamed protein product [Vitrella brassicaformis CCMP3155]
MRLKNVCKEPGTRAKEAFDLVHLDHKPMKVASVKGDTGFFVMVDDKTRHAMGKVKTLWSDGAKEFRYGKLEQYCIEHRIRQRFNAPYHRDEGGVVEHKVGMLMALMTSIMAESGMPDECWPYALDYAVKVYNMTVTKATRLPDGRPTSPHYALYGKKASIKGLFIFGSAAFVHQREEIRRGLQAKGKIMVMLGMAPRMKGTYRVLDLNTKKMYETPEVIVDERRFPFKERRERMMNPTPAPWAHNDQRPHPVVGRSDTTIDNISLPHTTAAHPPQDIASQPPTPTTPTATAGSAAATPPTLTPPSPPPVVVQPPQQQPPQQQEGRQAREGAREGLRQKVQPPKRDQQEGYDFSGCGQRQVNIIRTEEESKMPTMQDYISMRAPQLHGSTILRRQHAQREWQERINDRIRERLRKSPPKRYEDDGGVHVQIEGETEESCATTH